MLFTVPFLLGMFIIVQYLQDRLIFDSRKNGDFRILSNTVLQIWCYFIMLDMYLFFLFFFLPFFLFFLFKPGTFKALQQKIYSNFLTT